MVLVSKAVAISGAREGQADDGELTSIDAGTIPFYVEAPGAQVSIQGLRFIRPKGVAVRVYAVSGLGDRLLQDRRRRAGKPRQRRNRHRDELRFARFTTHPNEPGKT